MATTSNPKVSIALLAAQLAAGVVGRNDLICGTLVAGSTGISGQLYTDVAKLTKTQLDDLFGINSDLRNRISQFIDSNGGHSPVNVKAVTEADTTKSTVTVAIGTGAETSTAVGELIVSIVDQFQFTAIIPILSGEDDDVIVAKIVAAFTSILFPNMPVTVAVNGSNNWEIDITAIDGGPIGDEYTLEISGTAPGITLPTLDTPIFLTGGGSNPALTTFFDNLQSTRFTGINWPTAWATVTDIPIVKTYLDTRFNADNAILDGVAFIGKRGTFANNKALALLHNSQSICFGGAAVKVLQPADWTMSYFQGVRSRRLTPDANIASFITTTAGTLDAFGGPSLASLPYFNTPLNQLSVENPNDLYTNTEQSELEVAGFSVYGVNSAQNLMITGVMVTTFTTDVAGNPNESFHFLNFVDTASITREFFFNNLKSRFSQSRLTNGTLVPGRSIENQESIEAEFVKIYKQTSDLALTVAGAEAEIFFLDNLVLVLDLVGRKVTATFQLPIVTQLGEIIVTAQLNFNFQEGV